MIFFYALSLFLWPDLWAVEAQSDSSNSCSDFLWAGTPRPVQYVVGNNLFVQCSNLASSSDCEFAQNLFPPRTIDEGPTPVAEGERPYSMADGCCICGGGNFPTLNPSTAPVTSTPSSSPSIQPTSQPIALFVSHAPSSTPSWSAPTTWTPTTEPTVLPSSLPSIHPTVSAPTTSLPSVVPTQIPSTSSPTSSAPSTDPTSISASPTTIHPTRIPTTSMPTTALPTDEPCEPGYERSPAGECTRIYACDANPCDSAAVCRDLGPGQFECSCWEGYRGNGLAFNGTGCRDINECAEGTSQCFNPIDCVNLIPSRQDPRRYTCVCTTGYEWSNSLSSCVDVRECTDQTDNCHALADCENTDGSFLCSCSSGFIGDGIDCYLPSLSPSSAVPTSQPSTSAPTTDSPVPSTTNSPSSTPPSVSPTPGICGVRMQCGSVDPFELQDGSFCFCNVSCESRSLCCHDYFFTCVLNAPTTTTTISTTSTTSSTYTSTTHTTTSTSSSMTSTTVPEERSWCRTSGDGHFKTFDGFYYDFPGQNAYILVRDCRVCYDDRERLAGTPYCLGRFEVQILYAPTSTFSSAFSRSIVSVAVVVPNMGVLELSPGYTSDTHRLNGLTFRENNISLPYTAHETTMKQVPFLARGGALEIVISALGVTVLWDGATNVLVKVSAESPLVGNLGTDNVCGLCGNLNHQPADDKSFVSRFGHWNVVDGGDLRPAFRTNLGLVYEDRCGYNGIVTGTQYGSFGCPTTPPRRTTAPTISNPSDSPASSVPTLIPSAPPTPAPTVVPSTTPSISPSNPPSISPHSSTPSAEPSAFPTSVPTPTPSMRPSIAPSVTPTKGPSQAPSDNPSQLPSSTSPSRIPTFVPTVTPTPSPSFHPSVIPTHRPVTQEPTESPTIPPSAQPSTSLPSLTPSTLPSASPIDSHSPTKTPTGLCNGELDPQLCSNYTVDDCLNEELGLSRACPALCNSCPTAPPTCAFPIADLEDYCTVAASTGLCLTSQTVRERCPASCGPCPTASPTPTAPTIEPTSTPSSSPTAVPSKSPTNLPTSEPTSMPTPSPTERPSMYPSHKPTPVPSAVPSRDPTAGPTHIPSRSPSSGFPTVLPTRAPSTRTPSAAPTKVPTSSPSRYPTFAPTYIPTKLPSTSVPTLHPTNSPTAHPSSKPSISPSYAPVSSIPSSAPSCSALAVTPACTNERRNQAFQFCQPLTQCDGPYATCFQLVSAENAYENCIRDYCRGLTLACEVIVGFELECRAAGVTNLASPVEGCTALPTNTGCNSSSCSIGNWCTTLYTEDGVSNMCTCEACNNVSTTQSEETAQQEETFTTAAPINGPRTTSPPTFVVVTSDANEENLWAGWSTVGYIVLAIALLIALVIVFVLVHHRAHKQAVRISKEVSSTAVSEHHSAQQGDSVRFSYVDESHASAAESVSYMDVAGEQSHMNMNRAKDRSSPILEPQFSFPELLAYEPLGREDSERVAELEAHARRKQTLTSSL